MEEKDRLSAWIDKRNFSINEMAAAIGDSYSSVYNIAKGDRPINEAFKYRFLITFGLEEAVPLFDDLAESIQKNRPEFKMVLA